MKKEEFKKWLAANMTPANTEEAIKAYGEWLNVEPETLRTASKTKEAVEWYCEQFMEAAYN